MTRWGIPLDAETRARLPSDALELGTLHRDPDAHDGGQVLVFRDRFVALKVARRLGLDHEVRVLEEAPPAAAAEAVGA